MISLTSIARLQVGFHHLSKKWVSLSCNPFGFHRHTLCLCSGSTSPWQWSRVTTDHTGHMSIYSLAWVCWQMIVAYSFSPLLLNYMWIQKKSKVRKKLQLNQVKEVVSSVMLPQCKINCSSQTFYIKHSLSNLGDRTHRFSFLTVEVNRYWTNLNPLPFP